MDAEELFHKGGRTAGVYYCGVCKAILPDIEAAEACCTSPLCKCGSPRDYKWVLLCAACRELQHHEREAALVAKARHIPSHEWDDHVSIDGDYFSSIEDVLDHYAQDGSEVPTPVWGTRLDPMTFDAQRIVEYATEEMYEGALERIDIEAVRELQVLLDGWLAKYAPPPGCQEDNSIVIDLDPEVQRAALEDEP